jgi:hypothetical protein
LRKSGQNAPSEGLGERGKLERKDMRTIMAQADLGSIAIKSAYLKFFCCKLHEDTSFKRPLAPQDQAIADALQG